MLKQHPFLQQTTASIAESLSQQLRRCWFYFETFRTHGNHGNVPQLQEAAVCLGGLAQCIRGAAQGTLPQFCQAQQHCLQRRW